MSPDEQNLIRKMREEAVAVKLAAQARADKLLSKMADLYETIAAREKEINKLHGAIERLQNQVDKLKTDNQTLATNQTLTDPEYLQKLEDLEELMLEGRGDTTLIEAVRFIRRLRGVA